MVSQQSQSPKIQKSSKHIAEQINKNVVDSIGKQIVNSRVIVPQHQVQLAVAKKQKKNNDNEQKKMHQILRKKQQLQIQLNRVKFQEAAAKEERSPVLHDGDKQKNKYFRSAITPEQKLQIKKIIKDTKRFEKQAVSKTKRLQQKIQRLQEQQRMQKDRRQRQLSEKKKREIAEKLQQIKLRKQNRTKNINQTNKQFQRVNRKRFLHEAIDEKWKIVEASVEEQNQMMLQKKRAQMKYNQDQIRQHERRYSEIMLRQRQNRQAHSIKFHQDLLQKSRTSRHKYSTFFKTISEEQAQRRKIEQQKMKQSHLFMTRKQSYAATVKQKFKPKATYKQLSPKKDEPQLKKSKSLDYFALQKLGNDYMKQIHSQKSQFALNKSRQKEQDRKTQQVPFKYRDYLAQERSKRTLKNPQRKTQQFQQIKKLLNKRDGDGDYRLKKVKMLAGRLDEKSINTNNTKTLVETIAAKISIIQQFS